jgi:hypothetical protein
VEWSSLSEIAANLTFRPIDGVSVRFVESDQRDADALLLSPWPESVFACEAIWSRRNRRCLVHHEVEIDFLFHFTRHVPK